jgi:hypothetical protein
MLLIPSAYQLREKAFLVRLFFGLAELIPLLAELFSVAMLWEVLLFDPNLYFL